MNAPHPLNDEQINAMLAVPHWEPLGEDIDTMIGHLPEKMAHCERTTMLSWLYANRGVMSFLDISDKITGEPGDSISRRKKQVRMVLRGMERLRLVEITNFPLDEPVEVDEELPASDDNALGKTSLVSLTWSGMVWMRRAWQARQALVKNIHDGDHVRYIHHELVLEEDDGKGSEPVWVENISNADPDGPERRMARIREVMPRITSIFDMASAMR